MNIPTLCLVVLLFTYIFLLLFERKKNVRQSRKLVFILRIDSLIIKSSTMKFTLPKSKFPVKGHIAPSADNGAAEKVQSVNYSTDNDGIVKIGPDPDAPDDQTRFQLDWGGSLGTTNVGASADADLGEGVNTLTDTLEIEVIEDEATRLNMTLDIA